MTLAQRSGGRCSRVGRRRWARARCRGGRRRSRGGQRAARRSRRHRPRRSGRTGGGGSRSCAATWRGRCWSWSCHLCCCCRVVRRGGPGRAGHTAMTSRGRVELRSATKVATVLRSPTLSTSFFQRKRKVQQVGSGELRISSGEQPGGRSCCRRLRSRAAGRKGGGYRKENGAEMDEEDVWMMC